MGKGEAAGAGPVCCQQKDSDSASTAQAAKGLIGLLHAAQPGPSDAGFTRLVYWFTSSTRLRACKRCLSARLWRNEQIGRFLGTRLRWCKREGMGKRADTENHFCVRHASNQTASQLDLYSCIRKPIKRLWYLTSLAPAGLHAACEPGCAHPQTNQPLSARTCACTKDSGRGR